MNQNTQRKPLEPLVLLEDEPIAGFKEDKLGVEPFARVVAGAAVGTNGPFTIGVFANWGEGKTSLLKQAKTLVDEYNPEIVTVWFNAWQYEKEDHPIVPLVATIVRAVDQKLASEATLSATLKEGLSSVSRSLRAIAYGFSAKTKVAVPGFAEVEAGFVAKEMIDRYDKLVSAGDPLLDRTLYYNAFETLERVVTGETGIKVVVFVDDLDRCLPPKALKLLESIKLVLAQRGFVFALAVDRRILESFLISLYKNEYRVDDFQACGTQYLDKIVQLPLPIPPHRARFKGYIKQLLEGPVFQHESNTVVREAVSQLTDVLAAGSNHNPRSLVRFLNNLIVDRQIWSFILPQSEGDDENAEVKRLGLCAVCRILRQHLGDSLYLWLAGNNDICEKVAGNTLEKRTRKEKEQPTTLHEQSIEELELRLEKLSFLGDLLQTESGKSWLTDHGARREVDEFLVQQREEEPQDERRLLEERAVQGNSVSDRITAIQTLAEKWQDKATRKLLEDRAVQDENGNVRANTIQTLAKKWSDDATRKLFEDRAVQDKNGYVRGTAIEALAEKWPDDTTRKLLEDRAVQDEDGYVRGAAIWGLDKHWPDDATRKLLEDRAVQDGDGYARSAAMWSLDENWPDEATQKLFEERAGVDGAAASALGKLHSEFGRIVFTRDLDGLHPYLDPTQPISREHIKQAAKRTDVPADKVDETVRSLSEHMGWDITIGSGRKR